MDELKQRFLETMPHQPEYMVEEIESPMNSFSMRDTSGEDEGTDVDTLTQHISDKDGGYR